jgi:hypothetical protein
VGPGVQELPDGREKAIGDIIHTWVPTRTSRG